jgi:hypothetical protein
MHAYDDPTQRELKRQRQLLYRAAGVSGRGGLTVITLAALAIAGYGLVQWQQAQRQVESLQLRIFELTANRPTQGALEPISGDLVEAMLMQWTEWRYSKVKATVAADWGKVRLYLAPDLLDAWEKQTPTEIAAIERNDPGIRATADNVIPLEQLAMSDGRGTHYRYDVLLTVRGGQPDPAYRRVTLTLRTLSDAEYLERFKQWTQISPAQGRAYQKFNAARIEIVAYQDIEDYARYAVR